MKLNKISFQIYLLLITSFFFLACSKVEDQKSTTDTIREINTNSTSAKEIIIDMGGGFSLGNVFEIASNATTPATNKAIIDLYYKAGCRHVRIPTTWVEGFSSNIADANGNINFNHPRFLDLKKR
jgi:endoglucanase